MFKSLELNKSILLRDLQAFNLNFPMEQKVIGVAITIVLRMNEMRPCMLDQKHAEIRAVQIDFASRFMGF